MLPNTTEFQPVPPTKIDQHPAAAGHNLTITQRAAAERMTAAEDTTLMYLSLLKQKTSLVKPKSS